MECVGGHVTAAATRLMGGLFGTFMGAGSVRGQTELSGRFHPAKVESPHGDRGFKSLRLRQ